MSNMDNSRMSHSFAYYNPVHIHFGVDTYLKALSQILGPSLLQPCGRKRSAAQNTGWVRVGLLYGQKAMKANRGHRRDQESAA